MTVAEQKRAIVIGGGIGGLATAIALQQADWQVKVFERAETIDAVGAGISLWHNAIKALEQLGLGDTLARHSIEALSGGIMDWKGEILSALTSAQELGIDGHVVIALHRADLQAMLRDALAPDVLQTSAQFERFSQDQHGVTAYFADGREERADLLIGADGLRSKVRSQLFGFQEPIYSGQTAWRSVVPASTIKLSKPIGFEAWGHGQIFGMVPLSNDQIYWFAAANRPAGSQDAPQGRKAELRAMYAGWLDPVERLIEASAEDKILRNDIFDRDPINSWSQGRVVLLGDAAHPMRPNLGQGACQALEDAAVLGQALARHQDHTSAIQAYEKQRVGRAKQVVLASRQMNSLTRIHYPLMAYLRNQSMKIAPSSLRTKQIKNIILT